MGISLASASRGQLPHTLSSTSCGAHALISCRGHRPLEVYSLPPHTLSHLPAVVLMRSSAIVGIVLSWSAPSPHTLSRLLAVVLMRSSAVVGIVLSWSAPSPTLSLIYQQWCSCAHLLSWTSSSRGQLPPPPTHTLSLFYQLWCSYAHLLSWASSSRGLLPPSQPLSSTSCGALPSGGREFRLPSFA